MVTPRHWFNLYLAAVLLAAAVIVGGCASPESKKNKALSSLRLHLEVNPDASNRSEKAPIDRASPVFLNVEKSPFIDESEVAEAKVVDARGGFEIRIQFDRRGTWLLEQYTVANRGKRMAIFSEFYNAANPKTGIGRWLAAPLITQRVSNGLLEFTPDATREEAYQIVVGLNNVAKKTQEPRRKED